MAYEQYSFPVLYARETVWEFVGAYGELSYDKSAESNVRHGDFTEFKTPGTYKIISSPSGASYEFSIGDDLYDDVYKDVVLMLYKQRLVVWCSTWRDHDAACKSLYRTWKPACNHNHDDLPVCRYLGYGWIFFAACLYDVKHNICQYLKTEW